MTKRTLLLAAVAALLVPGTLMAQDPASAPHPLNAEYAQTPGAEKVEFRLLMAAQQAAKSKTRLSTAMHSSLPYARTADGKVLVEVVLDGITPGFEQAVTAAGVPVFHRSERFNRMTLVMDDPEAVTSLAAHATVRAMRPVVAPATSGAFSRQSKQGGSRESGSVPSGARQALNAQALLSSGGAGVSPVDGTGVIVGIISDSLAVTSNTRGPDYDELGGRQATQLSITINETGEYTLIVQSTSPDTFDLSWSASPAIGGAGAPPDDSSFGCQARIPLSGEGATTQYGTFLLPDPGDTGQIFVGGSCASQAAENYRTFGFSALAGTTVNFNIANATGDQEYFLSLRRDCDDVGTELACTSPAEVPAPPLVDGLRGQDSGDLPSSIFVPGGFPEPFPQGIDEGAAMAEIVHDVAPGATIAFGSGFPTPAQFAESILLLAGHAPYAADLDGLPVYFDRAAAGLEGLSRTRVIIDDLVFFSEPIYMPGIIAEAVDTVVNSDIREDGLRRDRAIYLNAAGNFGNNAIRAIYEDIEDGDEEWQGIPDGGDLHQWSEEYGAFLPVTVPPGESFVAYLQWNQPFTSYTDGGINGCQVNLDLYVVDEPNPESIERLMFDIFLVEPGRAGLDVQGYTGIPFGDPFELVAYRNVAAEPKTVYLALDHVEGMKDRIPQYDVPLEFSLLFNIPPQSGVRVGGIDPNNNLTGSSTVWSSQGYVDNALTVGAVNYWDTPNYDTGFGETDQIDMEDFSAKGGQGRLFFGRFGYAIDPLTYFEPDIAAVDALNTTFFLPPFGGNFDLDNYPNFFGTSAAAPAAGAVAALLLELNPTLVPEQVAAALRDTAIDVTGFRAAPGLDDTSGAGLVNALAAAEYVADKYGVGVGDPAAYQMLFDFAAGREGWDFQAPDEFTVPGSSAVPSLNLTSTTAFDTFGWWRSPKIAVASVEQPNQITINGMFPGYSAANYPPGSFPPPNYEENIIPGTGPASLFRATWQMNSDAADAVDVPVFRMRISTASFEQSSELTISSQGDAGLVPSVGDDQLYQQYFSLPGTQSNFRAYFDLLSTDPTNSAGVTVGARRVLIETIGTNALTNGDLEKLTLFETGQNGWEVVDARPELGGVGSSYDKALILGPVVDPAVTSFGFWKSPEAEEMVVRLERGKLYRATFRVESDVAAGQRQTLPVFRLRMNDGSNQMAALLHVDPQNNVAEAPSVEGERDYRLYFVTPEELVGAKIKLAFDYIYVPGGRSLPDRTVRLKSVRLDSFDAPVLRGF